MLKRVTGARPAKPLVPRRVDTERKAGVYPLCSEKPGPRAGCSPLCGLKDHSVALAFQRLDSAATDPIGVVVIEVLRS